MKNTLQRMISMLLCLVLCISWMPSVVFAEEEEALELTEAVEEVEQLTDEAAPVAEPADEEEPEAPAEPETEIEPEAEAPAEEEEQPVEILDTSEQPEEALPQEEVSVLDTTVDLLADDSLIPDANFRAALAAKLKCTSLTPARAAGVTYLDLSGRGIADLTGIEYFTGMVSLTLNNNSLTELDVTACPKLTALSCTNNALTSLKVTGCTKLEYLYCYGNSLTTLDLSGLTALTYLYCYQNNLESLDFTDCVALISAPCNDNNLKSLKAKGLKKLENLNSSNNSLKSLDLTDCSGLNKLYCSNNRLESLTLSGATGLTLLSCSNNELKTLDISSCKSLVNLTCNGNQLTTLDLGGCSDLLWLECTDNQLTSLDTSGTNLQYVQAGNQSLDTDSVNFTFTQLGCYLVADLKPVFGNINYSGLYLETSGDYEFLESGTPTINADGTCSFKLNEMDADELLQCFEDCWYTLWMYYELNNIYGYLDPQIIPQANAVGSAELERSYYLLEVGDCVNLSFNLEGIYESIADNLSAEVVDLHFYSEEASIELTDNKVTAIAPGTAELTFAVSLFDSPLGLYTCRVDVVGSLEQELLAVSLVDTAASLALYSTAYPQVHLLPELSHITVLEEGAAALREPVLSRAEFANEAVAQYFTLRMVDDRTVEIIPTEAAFSANVKGTFSSAINVYVKDAEEPITTSAALKLSVTNTKPTLKAADISFNTFFAGETKTIDITGAEIAEMTVVSAPDWLAIDIESGVVALTEDAPAKGSGKLVLDCTPAGFNLKLRVTIKVTAAYSAPVVKLAKSTVSVTAGAGAGNYTTATITPAACFGCPIIVTRITEGSGKKLVTYCNPETISEQYDPCPWIGVYVSPCDEGYYWVDVVTGIDDGQSHTLKVYLSAGGKETVLTVKVNSMQQVTFSAAASDTINSAVSGSYNVITLTAKGFNGEIWNDYGWMYYTVDGFYTKSGKEYVQYTGGGLTSTSGDELFDNTASFGVYRIAEMDLPKDTYYAKISTHIYDVTAEGGSVPGSVLYVKLKITFPSKAPAAKLSLKTTAESYYSSNGLAATVRATLTNLRDYNRYGVQVMKVYDADNGKQEPQDVTGWFNDNQRYESYQDYRNNILTCYLWLTDEGKCNAKPGDKYTIIMTCMNGDESALDPTGKTVSATTTLTLQGGKVKLTTKGTAQLLKKDRYDSTAVAVSFSGGTVDTNRAPILDAKSAQYFDASWGTDSQGNTALVLRWKDSNPANIKSCTVKFSCFMVGNNSTTKPDTFSLKVTIK